MQTRIKKLEEAIANHEAVLRQLDELFADGTRMQSLSPEEIRVKSAERAEQQKQLEAKMAEWESLAAS